MNCKRCGAVLIINEGRGGQNREYCDPCRKERRREDIESMRSKCVICGKEFPHKNTGKKYCSPQCSKRANQRNRRATKYSSGGSKAVQVLYPGCDTWDGWTRRDYELYKHELPAGSEVRFG